MVCSRILLSRHALQRMFQRSIAPREVHEAIVNGEAIEQYPDDQPFPSTLLLAVVDGRPLHVLVSRDPLTATCHVVTVYVPDAAQWSEDFRVRRRS